MRYNPKAVEFKWQQRWLKEKTYEPVGLRPARSGGRGSPRKAGRPFYNLMMFPYPSAEGLHIGGMRTFTGVDIFGRMKRMQGHDVFEPMGLDGFGIHSENFAIKIGKHPTEHAKDSEKNFYRQLAAMGNGFSWEERLETYDPDYYKWTQWIFGEMFRRGLAYRKKSPVNWCPSCMTVLADEQVINGQCERCGSKVIKKDLEQWFFKITAYAERLLKNLENIDWSERVKIAQRNWIGKSEGGLIDFPVVIVSEAKQSRRDRRGLRPRDDESIKVFTTRPDTLFGATYMVLGPEHPLLANDQLPITNDQQVREYIRKAKAKTEEERIAEGREKTGVELEGIMAINPANKEEIPIWVADYVLGHVGTGAIMAVPAHDERDYEFAVKFELPVKPVILPKFEQDQRDKKLEKLVRELAGVAKKFQKRFILSGGWAIDAHLGERLRNHEDIDLCADFRETLWWKKQFEERGFAQKISDSKKDPRYFLEMTHEDGMKVDVIGIGVDKRNEVYDMEKGRPDYWKVKEKKKINTGKIGDTTVEYFVPEVQAWLKFAHREKDAIDLAAVGLGSWDGAGVLMNSGKFTGMDSETAKWGITKAVGGKRTARYRLRDWLVSRQRYWGPPIPMIYCESCATAGHGEQKEMQGWYAVPDRDLPVKLPYVKNFRPTGTGKSPLAAVKSFYEVKCPKCRSNARRETDVSDTFLDSAWYYLRYPSVRDSSHPWNPVITRKWLPVNTYIGGAEHAVLHLLYSRFLAMVFHDWGLLHFEEPFTTFRAHGLITYGGAKMSKSKGNIVSPDSYIKAFGTDAIRLYLAFLAPFTEGGDFRDEGIRGLTRFLERIWRFVQARFLETRNKSQIPNPKSQTRDLNRAIHQAIQKVGRDIEALQYNTAISALMVLLNTFEAHPEVVAKEDVSVFLRLLAPFAPHITEELWHQLGNTASIHRSPWPQADPRYLKAERQTLIIQVNGKVRDRVEVEAGAGEAMVREMVLAREKVRQWIGSKPVRKFIYVPGRIVNIVIS